MYRRISRRSTPCPPILGLRSQPPSHGILEVVAWPRNASPNDELVTAHATCAKDTSARKRYALWRSLAAGQISTPFSSRTSPSPTWHVAPQRFSDERRRTSF